MPHSMWPLCKTWRKRTMVTLSLGEMEWHVEVLRSKNVFRFGIGWNDFTFDNKFEAGQVLLFQFVGNLNFQVTNEV